MLRGTRVIEGREASLQVELINKWRSICLEFGLEEVIVPTIWEQKTFVNKAGKEVLNQMYAFKDKGDRDICLVPEITAIIQEQYKKHWAKSKPKPHNIFYVSKCFRYERPQSSRFREFTQFGVESLGENVPSIILTSLLTILLDETEVDFKLQQNVKRGLDYYVGNGFEAVCPGLGDGRQIAGGGAYESGCGFAIGVDRVVKALLG